jgi:hypothetical protein
LTIANVSIRRTEKENKEFLDKMGLPPLHSFTIDEYILHLQDLEERYYYLMSVIANLEDNDYIQKIVFAEFYPYDEPIL